MKIMLILTACLMAQPLLAQENLLPECNTVKNSPTLKENQKIVKKLQSAIRNKSLMQQRRTFCEEGPQEKERILWSSQKGVPQIYTSVGVGEDHGHRITGYYDEDGKIRALYVRVVSVSGCEESMHAEFDAVGKVLCGAKWNDSLCQTGLWDPFLTDPEFHNPKASFSAAPPSREIPAGQKGSEFCK